MLKVNAKQIIKLSQSIKSIYLGNYFSFKHFLNAQQIFNQLTIKEIDFFHYISFSKNETLRVIFISKSFLNKFNGRPN